MFLLTVDFHTCSVSFSHYSANGHECKQIKTLLSQLTLHLVFIYVYVYIKCLTTKKIFWAYNIYQNPEKKNVQKSNCSQILGKSL